MNDNNKMFNKKQKKKKQSFPADFLLVKANDLCPSGGRFFFKFPALAML